MSAYEVAGIMGCTWPSVFQILPAEVKVYLTVYVIRKNHVIVQVLSYEYKFKNEDFRDLIKYDKS
jgi:hypothetical protein